MNMPVDRVLEMIRGQTDPLLAWTDVLSLCRIAAPSGLWNSLPVPGIARDISAAVQWLSSQLVTLSDASGIYLGLDTLNMCGGQGKNVGIGGSAACDPSRDQLEWVYGKMDYGDEHLIHGLYELHSAYSQPEWKQVFSFSDYILFLAYSGIVLGQAFVRLPSDRLLLPVWGFHDGDLFILGRKTPEKFEFICK